MLTRSAAKAKRAAVAEPPTPPARSARGKRAAPEPALSSDEERCTFADLPHDAVRLIISRLDTQAASALRATCQELKELTVRDRRWGGAVGAGPGREVGAPFVRVGAGVAARPGPPGPLPPANDGQ